MKLPNIKKKSVRIGALLAIIISTGFFLSVTVRNAVALLPQPSDLYERNIPKSSILYDQEGEVIYRYYDEVDRYYLSLSEMGSLIAQAVLAAEDSSFYTHPGFDLSALFRCGTREILYHVGLVNNGQCGGSTITQQLVKNTILEDKFGERAYERSLSRKLIELYYAYLLEDRYSKDEILEMYLNEISLGGVHYGVGSASISYFGKSVDKLTYGEAAVLAGIIQQPSIAMVNSEESELVIKNRQEYVIEQLHKHRSKLGIDEDAEIDSDYVIQRQDNSVDVLHFVHYVENKLRTEYNLRDIHNKGYRIYTTLNMQKQNQYLMLLRGNESSIVEDTAIAAVVLDSVSGGVRVYVGSLYYDEEILGSKIDMTQVPRMAGGTILPFSYAKAFEKGLQVYSLAPELPYTLMGKPDFSIRYEGGMSVRKSLATGNPISSLYVADYASPVEIRDMFVEAGLLDVKGFIGISESIGNLEVNLLSLVSAYTVFANGGSYNKAYVIERIEDQAGQVIYMYDTSDSRRIISNGTVDKINWILCDMGGYQDRVGEEYMGQIDGVCGRTGLSGNQDSYTSVLYDKDNISGVWYGRINSNQPLPSSDNYNHSLDLNAAAYQSVFRGSNPIRISEEYKLVDVCTDSGKEQNKQSCSSERAIMVGNGDLASDERFTVHLCIVENGYVESMDDVNRAMQNGIIQTKTYIDPFLENSEHVGTYNFYLNDFGYITSERYRKLVPVSCELPLE